MSTYFIRSRRERMKAIFQRGADDRRGHFIRSRFIRSLKEKSWEPMDGGLICPPSLFRSRWLELSRNDWERLGTHEGQSTAITPAGRRTT